MSLFRPAPDAARLLLRASLATMWLSHAWLKYGVFTMAGFQGFLAQQHLPTWIAWPVLLAEVSGGLLIALGAGGRWASIALLPILAGATAVHWPNGWVFTAPNGGWEYPVFLAAMSVVHALLGDGRFALRAARAEGDAAAGRNGTRLAGARA
ncbi:DoxX family protein [Aquabacterium sp.]|uniref:DoxX family protein n=1 Tax=Aquabacterium sp. TaxID=1872578 RepID=UPI003784508E